MKLIKKNIIGTKTNSQSYFLRITKKTDFDNREAKIE